MRKHTGLVASGAMLAATIGLFGTAASASASTTSASTASPVVGYTYLDGNTATSNTIDAFADTDGSVSPVGSGTFAAGSIGSGAGLGSQGAIQVTQDHRFLLAVDAGSNQISVLRITAGGVPVPVASRCPPAGTTRSALRSRRPAWSTWPTPARTTATTASAWASTAA